MRTSRVLLAVVAVVAVAAMATAEDAPTGKKGTTLRGYTFGSDVGEYLNISRDIMAIRKVLNQKHPDYALAQAIYMDGSNARRPDGRLYSLRQMATDPKFGEGTWSEYQKFFGSPIWLDDALQRAFGGIPPFDEDVERVQMIVKTLESSLQVAYVLHEFDAAIAKAKAGKTDDATGAPRSIDEAWAVFVGGEPQTGLATVTIKRANEFGTKFDCDTSKVTKAAEKLFVEAQAAARKGDAATLLKLRDQLKSLLATTYVQAIITYAHEMYLDKLANISAREHQTEAYGFYRTIAPLIAKANNTASAALDFWLFPGQPVVDDVDLKAARALAASYKGLGITAADVGVYGQKQPSLGCKAYVPTSGSGLLSTTNAKDSLRPTEPAKPAAKPAAAPKAAPKAAAKPAGRRRSLFGW